MLNMSQTQKRQWVFRHTWRHIGKEPECTRKRREPSKPQTETIWGTPTGSKVVVLGDFAGNLQLKDLLRQQAWDGWEEERNQQKLANADEILVKALLGNIGQGVHHLMDPTRPGNFGRNKAFPVTFK